MLSDEEAVRLLHKTEGQNTERLKRYGGIGAKWKRCVDGGSDVWRGI